MWEGSKPADSFGFQPLTLFRDGNRDNLIFAPVERLDNRGRGADRHLVLAGTSTEKDRDANF